MYSVIEYTPGYLPEEDEPLVFDQYQEAFNYVQEQRQELFNDEFSWEESEEDGDDASVFMLDVGDMEQWGFVYYDKRKTYDLGRIIEIIPLEE